VCHDVEEGPDGQPEKTGEGRHEDVEDLLLVQRVWLQLKTVIWRFGGPGVPPSSKILTFVFSASSPPELQVVPGHT
jgi:hypothetical protein